MPILGIIDIQPVPPQHADLEGDLLNLLHGLALEEPQFPAGRIPRLEHRVHPRALWT